MIERVKLLKSKTEKHWMYSGGCPANRVPGYADSGCQLQWGKPKQKRRLETIWFERSSAKCDVKSKRTKQRQIWWAQIFKKFLCNRSPSRLRWFVEKMRIRRPWWVFSSFFFSVNIFFISFLCKTYLLLSNEMANFF